MVTINNNTGFIKMLLNSPLHLAITVKLLKAILKAILGSVVFNMLAYYIYYHTVVQ